LIVTDALPEACQVNERARTPEAPSTSMAMDFVDLTSYSSTSETLLFASTYEHAQSEDLYVPDHSFDYFRNNQIFEDVVAPANLTFWSTGNERSFADTYDNAYGADSYLPDYPLDNCANDRFFKDSVAPANPILWSTNAAADKPSAATGANTSSGVSTGPITTNSNAKFDPHQSTQSTPSGAIQDLDLAFVHSDSIKLASSPSFSPRSLTRPSISSNDSWHLSGEEEASKPSARKRGRPRIYRHSGTCSSRCPASEKAPDRIPHNQVERKYREGLNMVRERLRRAVPTLAQSEKDDFMGAVKPSKAMVLSAAINYIKKIEKERDEALDEVRRLGGEVRHGKAITNDNGGMAWRAHSTLHHRV
jgi:hypothetical protein